MKNQKFIGKNILMPPQDSRIANEIRLKLLSILRTIANDGAKTSRKEKVSGKTQPSKSGKIVSLHRGNNDHQLMIDGKGIGRPVSQYVDKCMKNNARPIINLLRDEILEPAGQAGYCKGCKIAREKLTALENFLKRTGAT